MNIYKISYHAKINNQWTWGDGTKTLQAFAEEFIVAPSVPIALEKLAKFAKDAYDASKIEPFKIETIARSVIT